jgi:predicted nucleic acid-binding protein
MSSFGVVLDANVLFPASLRDTLLRTATAGLYRLQLTDDILEEVRRNLVKNNMPEVNAQRLIDVIKNVYEDAFVTRHDELINVMRNQEKDRHVLAAAVKSGAQVIVTQNLKDFPQQALEPYDIEAQSPDDFLVHLLHLNKGLMAKILLEQARDLRKPARTVSEVLDTLAQHVPTFAYLARTLLHFEEQYPWTANKDKDMR